MIFKSFLCVLLYIPLAHMISANFFVELRLVSTHSSMIINYPQHTVQKVGNTTFVIGPFRENDPITISLSLPVIPFRYVSRSLTTERTWNSEHFEPLSTFVHYRSICGPSLYGPRCIKYCRKRDDSTGHFTCSESGLKICLPGWQGANCDLIFTTPKPTETIGTTMKTSSVQTTITTTTTMEPATSAPTENEKTMSTMEKISLKPTSFPFDVSSDYFIVEHRFPGLILLICLGFLLGVLLFLIFLILCVHRDVLHPFQRFENWLSCRRNQREQYAYQRSQNQCVHKVYSLPIDLTPTAHGGVSKSHLMTGDTSMERYSSHRMSTTSCPPVGPSSIIPSKAKAFPPSPPALPSTNNSSNCYFAYEAIDMLPIPNSRKPYVYMSQEDLKV
ncbi:unnamed protein product [Auanema sp. JU1783]|nr:unnamed protein product [Auanema sp. JU1783]